MRTPDDPLAVAGLVIDELERLGARYSIGGSMASSFAGEPRSTLDVDIVVELTAAQADGLARGLTGRFYFDRHRLTRAIATGAIANLVHLESSVKIDLFPAGGTPLDRELLDRRRPITAGDPPRQLFVHAPEDILLQKLRWFRLGGEVSDRQWRDVLAILRAQGAALDDAYVTRGARLLGVEDLLKRAK